MAENLKKAGGYILQILVTAIASAFVAILQNYIATHGIHAEPLINPTTTATIGAGLSSGHMAIKITKISKIS